MKRFAELVLAQLDDIRRATLIGVKDTLTLEECAMLTGYSAQSLYTFTSKRQIPHFKRGNYLYFSKKAVEEWLQSNPVPTLTETGSEASTYVATHKSK